ncbi:MAG: hypothetical protein N4A33_10140 [Bacteriovoracaceae bacterium]|nr:hypothetical protein [Bacteriovoracaceae bacterium]
MKKVSFVILITLLCSCASSSSNFKENSLEKGEGIYFGSMRVWFDGQEVTGTCNLIFTDFETSEKDSFINIDENGFFIGKAFHGKNFLTRLACRKGLETKLFFMEDFKEVKFNLNQGQKTYIGNIKAFYDSSDEKINPAWFLLGGVGAGIAASKSKDYKRIYYVIESKTKDILKKYNAAIKKRAKMKIRKGLLEVPKEQQLSPNAVDDLLDKYKE